jgi:uncharacterized repeat protein (TIGR03803 family)
MRLRGAMGDLGRAFVHPVHRWIVLYALVALASGCGGGGGGQTQPATYTVGGSISGLTAGGLILAYGNQTVSPAANAMSFVFPTQSTSGTSYSVSVQTEPTGQTCTVSSASGTVTTANVTNVVVTCASEAAVLYSFGAVPDGAVPTAGVTQGSDGNFYGTTYLGGANNGGTVFMVTPAGVGTVIDSLPATANSTAGLLQTSGGNFYGTTSGGGTNGNGSVFELSH